MEGDREPDVLEASFPAPPAPSEDLRPVVSNEGDTPSEANPSDAPVAVPVEKRRLPRALPRKEPLVRSRSVSDAYLGDLLSGDRDSSR